MNNKHVRIFDTTLRDGEQSPGNSMNLKQKLRMAHQLERLNVDVIEAGFPISSRQDFEAVREIAKVCEKAEVVGLCRALEKDIKCAWDALQYARSPRIHTFIATSPIHMEFKLKKTEDEVLEMAIAAVKMAKAVCPRVEFSAEDAFRSEPGFLYRVLEAAIAHGADVVNIPDTVGYATPQEYGAFIQGIMENVSGIDGVIVSTHCHDDLGMAVANSLAGVKNGARQVECTVNGIGERAGNASLEEVVMAINTRKDFFDLETQVVAKEIYPSSRLLSSITGVPVQPNKAIVGANAFAHESGIHQDGVLKYRTTYEIMKAEDIGLESNSLVLGKHSGRHALKNQLEQMGYELSEEELDGVFERFKNLAEKKKVVYEEDLILLMNRGSKEDHMFTYKDFYVVAGNVERPHAKVTLVGRDGKEVSAEAEGDGPVDSAYSAVNQIVQLENELTEYSVNAVTQGIDAQATVNVQIRVGGKIYSNSDSDTDIIVASVKSYVGALNKALAVMEAAKLKEGGEEKSYHSLLLEHA